jgi:hypothetical protein
MRILFVTANSPKAYLDIEREHRALLGFAREGQHDLTILPAAEISDLENALRRKEGEPGFDVLHFSGHATENEAGHEGGLKLRGAGKKEEILRPSRLREFLEGSGVQLVVLNACESWTTAEAASQAVPAAIGTNKKIADWAARQFTSEFYGALNEHRTLTRAFDAAREKAKAAEIYQPAGNFEIDLPTTPTEASKVAGDSDFYRFFYGAYFDEQIAAEERAILWGRWIFGVSLSVALAIVLYSLHREGAELLAQAARGLADAAGSAAGQAPSPDAAQPASSDPGMATAWTSNVWAAVKDRFHKLVDSDDALSIWQQVQAIDKATPIAVTLFQTRLAPMVNPKIKGLRGFRQMLDGWEDLPEDERQLVRDVVHNSLKESLSQKQGLKLTDTFNLTLLNVQEAEPKE